METSIKATEFFKARVISPKGEHPEHYTYPGGYKIEFEERMSAGYRMPVGLGGRYYKHIVDAEGALYRAICYVKNPIEAEAAIRAQGWG